MKVINNILVNLFGEGEALSTGEKLFFKIFEFAVLYLVIDLAWFWAFYTLKIQDVVLPLGIAEHIDISFMHNNNLPLYFAGVLTVACVLGFLRVMPKVTYSIGILLLHLLYAGRFSIGEIPHSANFAGLSLLGLAIGFLVFDKDTDKRIPLTMGVIIFFMGFGYTTAAFSKLIATGFHWADGRHLWMWMTEKSVDDLSKFGFHIPNIAHRMAFASIPVATAFLAFGLISEFFGFLMWYRKLRPYVVLAVMGLHVGIYLTMNIWFGNFMIELILIGFPWHILLNKLDLSAIENWKYINR